MSDLRRVVYDPTDREMRRGVLSLLAEAFGSEYMAYYEVHLQTLASRELTFLYVQREEVVAHVQAVTYLYREMKMAYLYAVCTRMSARGEGIMSRVVMPEVMRGVYDMGYAGTFLVPSESSLVGFYEQFGFRQMQGGAYTKPVPEAPAITPGREVMRYLEQTAMIGTEESDSSGRMPLAAGWMLHMSSGSLPQDTVLVSPLT